MNLEKSNLQKKFGRNLIIKENLSRYNWFNLGGPADIFFRPESKDQLIEFLKSIQKENYKIHVLGAGSNTLIRDSGFRGVVIKLGSKFANITLKEKDVIEVGAGALDKNVSNFAKNNNIGNLEFLSCIPGTIGGSVTMNSGCYGSDISKVLISIRILNFDGLEKEIHRDQIKFEYRGTNLPKDCIILSAKLKGSTIKKDLIEKKQNDFIKNKKKTQPNQIKTGGSTFKNHKDIKAWKVIKDAGCDKFSIGDAKISEKHCNFFFNDGKAKTTDIEKLINKVKQEVQTKTGINLELEIKIIGDEK